MQECCWEISIRTPILWHCLDTPLWGSSRFCRERVVRLNIFAWKCHLYVVFLTFASMIISPWIWSSRLFSCRYMLISSRLWADEYKCLIGSWIQRIRSVIAFKTNLDKRLSLETPIFHFSRVLWDIDALCYLRSLSFGKKLNLRTQIKKFKGHRIPF